MDHQTKCAEFVSAVHTAVVSMQNALVCSTEADVDGQASNVLLAHIATAELAIVKTRALIGVPSSLWMRPLPEPSIN